MASATETRWDTALTGRESSLVEKFRPWSRAEDLRYFQNATKRACAGGRELLLGHAVRVGVLPEKLQRARRVAAPHRHGQDRSSRANHVWALLSIGSLSFLVLISCRRFEN